MNSKGLTLVELIVTFALATGLVIILLNVLIIIKNNYQDTDVKTTLVVNQSTLSNLMNNAFRNDNLASYSTCEGDFCYEFIFKDGTSSTLKIVNKRISFGEYIYDLDSSTNVVSPSLTIDNPYLVIKIPIKTKLYPNEDFGINLVYKRGE